MSEQGDAELYEFTEEEWMEIRKISEEKYETWDWNYGHSPNLLILTKRSF